MKILFALAAVLLLVSLIDAAPKPKPKPQTKPQVKRTAQVSKSSPHSVKGSAKVQRRTADKSKRQIPIILAGNGVYPNYYGQAASPLIDFQSALQAAFLSGVRFAELEKHLKNQNLTDSNGKPLPLDAKILAPFEGVFSDKIGDAKNGTDLHGKLIAFENIGGASVVNPFFLANSVDGQVVKGENGASGVKAGNSSAVTLVNPYRGSHVDLVFGPEIAPRYEIHYSPAQGLTLDPIPPFANSAIGVSPAAIGSAAYGSGAYGSGAYGPAFIEPAVYGSDVGPYSGFGVAPGFNNALGPYPYPYPFLPGFDLKGFKPNGKGNGGNKPGSAEPTTEATSDATPSAEGAPSDSSSEPPSESSSSEAPSQ